MLDLNRDISNKNILNDNFINDLVWKQDVIEVKNEITEWIVKEKLKEPGIDMLCYSEITIFLSNIYNKINRLDAPKEQKEVLFTALIGSIMELWGKSINIKESCINYKEDNEGKHIDELYSDKFMLKSWDGKLIASVFFRTALFNDEDTFKGISEFFGSQKAKNVKIGGNIVTTYKTLYVDKLRNLYSYDLDDYVNKNIDGMLNMAEHSKDLSDIKVLSTFFINYYSRDKVSVGDFIPRDLSDNQNIVYCLAKEKELYNTTKRFYDALERTVSNKEPKSREPKKGTGLKTFGLQLFKGKM